MGLLAEAWGAQHPYLLLLAGQARWAGEQISSWAGCWGLAPCRYLHVWCLQLSWPAPGSLPAHTHCPGLCSPAHMVSSCSLLQILLQPLPRHRDGFLSPFGKVIKRCTCKTLHSGKQIMQNTLSGISHKWIQPTVGTLLPGFFSGHCEKLLARLLQPGKWCSAQSSAPSQPPGTSSGEGWLVACMAQGQTCWEG